MKDVMQSMKDTQAGLTEDMLQHAAEIEEFGTEHPKVAAECQEFLADLCDHYAAAQEILDLMGRVEVVDGPAD